ncbi:MAG: hypothetical protein ABII88_03240 [Candidatus Omnitrophota bacterium]
MKAECVDQNMNNNKGVALILTFMIMTALIIIVAAYLFLIVGGARLVNAQVNSTQALYLSEAGLNKAIWYLLNTAPDGSTDGSWRTSAYPAVPGTGGNDPQQETLGAGTYTLWVENSGSNILITGRGTINNTERIIQQEISLTPGIPEAFMYVQHSGNNTNMNNTGGTITGDISVGGNFNYGGGLSVVGTITEDSDVVTPAVSMSDYAAIAGSTVSGNKTFTSGTYSGIWYISGNVTIDDDVIFNGTIIAAGNISMTNSDNITITHAGSYPALVSGGDITGNNMADCSITGLIYAANNITLNNNEDGEINGTLIAGNNLILNNGEGLVINYDETIRTACPPYFSGGEEYTISAISGSWTEL